MISVGRSSRVDGGGVARGGAAGGALNGSCAGETVGAGAIAAGAGAVATTAGVAAIGLSAWRPIGIPHAGQKRSSPPWIAAQRGHAAMPASRSTVTGWCSPRAASSARSSPSKLASVAQLGHHQRVVALAEAVHLEYQPPEVAVGKLAWPCAGSARAGACVRARESPGSVG